MDPKNTASDAGLTADAAADSRRDVTEKYIKAKTLHESLWWSGAIVLTIAFCSTGFLGVAEIFRQRQNFLRYPAEPIIERPVIAIQMLAITSIIFIVGFICWGLSYVMTVWGKRLSAVASAEGWKVDNPSSAQAKHAKLNVIAKVLLTLTLGFASLVLLISDVQLALGLTRRPVVIPLLEMIDSGRWWLITILG